jgi:5-bromo-4-chloroindolyl phosphate hydrolysis protein
VICEKVQRIENVTVKIFRLVDEKPEKASQIRRFMNYYLPTTLKLLHSYETLEKQGVDGENITTAKNDIVRVLDTLAAGFEQQLDNLFMSDKIDISADIDVLENLMRRDGLTDDGNILKTSDGGTLRTSDGGTTMKTSGGV